LQQVNQGVHFFETFGFFSHFFVPLRIFVEH
jgi:hypothetical protein